MKFKKILTVILTICLILSLAGCVGNPNINPDNGEIDKSVETENSSEESDWEFLEIQVGKDVIQKYSNQKTIYNIEFDNIRLSKNGTAKYPELAKTFENINKSTNNRINDIENNFADIYKDMSSEPPSVSMLEHSSKIHIQRADKLLVSYAELNYIYSGGAHGNYGFSGHNYDTATGKEMELSDVIKDTKNLGTILEKILTQKYSDTNFFNLKETISERKPEEFEWTLDYQGITFWFDPYDLASFADGALTAKIWFCDYPDMFNTDYSYSPTDYAVSIPTGVKIDLDSKDSNGNRQCLTIGVYQDMEYSTKNLYITLDDKEYNTDDDFTFDFIPYLVHRDGKNYLYANALCEGDSEQFLSFSLNNSQINHISTLENCGLINEWVTEGTHNGIAYQNVFLNPVSFNLMSRIQVLGTRTGYASYTVNKSDGVPQKTSDSYNIESDTPVVTATAIKAKRIKDEKSIDIPENTALHPLRTDAKTFVELKTEDGTEIRLNCNTSGFPVTIEGVDESKCFKDLMYAG